jgi:hypothetical protein
VFKIEPKILPKGGLMKVEEKILEKPDEQGENKQGEKRKSDEFELLANDEPPKKKERMDSALSEVSLKVMEEKNIEKSPVFSQEFRFSQEFKSSQDFKSRGLLSLSFSQNSQEGLPMSQGNTQDVENWELPSPGVNASQLYSLNSQLTPMANQEFKVSSSFDVFFEKLDK